MSDTPETDAALQKCWDANGEPYADHELENMVDVARRLERERNRAMEQRRCESRWSAVHSGGHWWIADEKTGDLLEIIAGSEGEIAEAIAKLHNSTLNP